MPDQINQNYFQLLNLPVSYQLDLGLLDRHYRALQSEVHPDRFVSASTNEQMRSMQLATLANDAYVTLKHPTKRGRYLLQLQGVETLEESNTAMPADFLMLQMEWREAVEDAQASTDLAALDNIMQAMQESAQALQQQLQAALDKDKQLDLAAEAVRKLSFIDKVRADVDKAIEQLEYHH